MAGVGRATVSRAVNGSAHVSRHSREAVAKAIAVLGYVPNRAARALVTRRTDSVALVVSESDERFFSEPFFAGIVRGASSAFAATPRQLLIAIAATPMERKRLERYLTGQHVDGVLLLSLHGEDPLPAMLEASGLPTVLGGRPVGRAPVSWVDVDNAGGAALAVEHLLARGAGRVATIHGPLDLAAGQDRLDGYRDALARAGRAYDDALVEPGDFAERSGRDAMAALLDRAPDLDAVFAASDLMAAGALRTLRQRSRRVPEDVAVVGFDDAPVSGHTEPALTTVHQPVEAIGRAMARLMTARLDGVAAELTVTLPTHLVVRASA